MKIIIYLLIILGTTEAFGDEWEEGCNYCTGDPNGIHRCTTMHCQDPIRPCIVQDGCGEIKPVGPYYGDLTPLQSQPDITWMNDNCLHEMPSKVFFNTSTWRSCNPTIWEIGNKRWEFGVDEKGIVHAREFKGEK